MHGAHALSPKVQPKPDVAESWGSEERSESNETQFSVEKRLFDDLK
jgi:hypothetical protein